MNEDQLIGFTFATLSLSGKVENQLTEKASQIFYRTYNYIEAGKQQLKASVDRLVY